MSENKEPEIIIGSAKRKLKLPLSGVSKRTKIITLVAVVVILIVGGAVYLSSRNQKDKDSKAFKVAAAQAAEFKNQDDKNGAKRVWEEFLATKPKDKEIRGQAEYQLASVWYTLNDYSSARKYGESALKSVKDPGYGMYIFMADLTKAQKDYKAAADYYQKTYEMLQPVVEKHPKLGGLAGYARNNVQLMNENLKQQQSGDNGQQ